MTGVGTGRVGPDHDAGSASVWTAALLLLVVTATVLGVGGATATAARHAAQLAADLAALAGAGRIGVADDACPTAARVAAANRVALRRCEVEVTGLRTGEVRVQVGRTLRWAGAGFDVTARARAARVAPSAGLTAHPVAPGSTARGPPGGPPHTVDRPPCGRRERVAA